MGAIRPTGFCTRYGIEIDQNKYLTKCRTAFKGVSQCKNFTRKIPKGIEK